MAWSWKIVRAAVEQEILFPSRSVFETYIAGLEAKREPFEVLTATDNSDGTVTVVMRKRYNPHNAFLPSAEVDRNPQNLS